MITTGRDCGSAEWINKMEKKEYETDFLVVKLQNSNLVFRDRTTKRTTCILLIVEATIFVLNEINATMEVENKWFQKKKKKDIAITSEALFPFQISWLIIIIFESNEPPAQCVEKGTQEDKFHLQCFWQTKPF